MDVVDKLHSTIKNHHLKHLIGAVIKNWQLLSCFHRRLADCTCKPIDDLKSIEIKFEAVIEFAKTIDWPKIVAALDNNQFQVLRQPSGLLKFGLNVTDLQRQSFGEIIRVVDLQEKFYILYKKLAKDINCYCCAKFNRIDLLKRNYDCYNELISKLDEMIDTSHKESKPATEKVNGVETIDSDEDFDDVIVKKENQLIDFGKEDKQNKQSDSTVDKTVANKSSDIELIIISDDDDDDDRKPSIKDEKRDEIEKEFDLTANQQNHGVDGVEQQFDKLMNDNDNQVFDDKMVDHENGFYTTVDETMAIDQLDVDSRLSFDNYKIGTKIKIEAPDFDLTSDDEQADISLPLGKYKLRDRSLIKKPIRVKNDQSNEESPEDAVETDEDESKDDYKVEQEQESNDLFDDYESEGELNELAINQQHTSIDGDDDEVEDDDKELEIVYGSRLSIVNQDEAGADIVNETTTDDDSDQQTESGPNVNHQNVEISPPIINYNLRDRNNIGKTVANWDEAGEEKSSESSGEDDESDEYQVEADKEESDEGLFDDSDDNETAENRNETRFKRRQRQLPVGLSRNQPGCNFKTGDRLQLYQHKVRQHQITKSLAKFVCFDCGKRFQNNGSLKAHRLQHANALPYHCDHHNCGKRFVSKTELIQNKYSHAKKKLFRCRAAGCGKQFQSPLSQRRHFLNYHKKQNQFKPTPTTSTPSVIRQSIDAGPSRGVGSSSTLRGTADFACQARRLADEAAVGQRQRAKISFVKKQPGSRQTVPAVLEHADKRLLIGDRNFNWGEDRQGPKNRSRLNKQTILDRIDDYRADITEMIQTLQMSINRPGFVLYNHRKVVNDFFDRLRTLCRHVTDSYLVRLKELYITGRRNARTLPAFNNVYQAFGSLGSAMTPQAHPPQDKEKSNPEKLQVAIDRYRHAVHFTHQGIISCWNNDDIVNWLQSL